MENLLRKVPLFKEFTEQELAELIQLGYQQDLAKGEIVFRENDPGDSFYMIIAGAVEIWAEKINQVLRKMEAGDFFGELSLMLGIPRTATVKCLEDCTFFVFNREGLQKLLAANKLLADSIPEKLNEYVEEITYRKELLREAGLLEDEESFDSQPVTWIRQQIKAQIGI